MASSNGADMTHDTSTLPSHCGQRTTKTSFAVLFDGHELTRQLLPLTGRNYSLVVYVRTAPSEYGGRQLVRRMWAGELRCHGALVLFSTARSNDTNVMRSMQVPMCPVHISESNPLSMQAESAIYGDLLVFDYNDNYYRLSWKSWMNSEYHVQRFSGAID
jgi:hypothetical protein